MNKTIGYVLIGIGLIVFLLSFPQLSTYLKLNFSTTMGNVVMGVGILILILGAFMVSKGSSGKVEEVPIYQDKEVVGFRRIKK
jgi:hypothetical protein